MSELKPCPFCGNNPVMETYQTMISIRCDPCGVARAFRGPLSGARTEPIATGSPQHRFTHPEEDYNGGAITNAVEAWNRRAPAQQQDSGRDAALEYADKIGSSVDQLARMHTKVSKLDVDVAKSIEAVHDLLLGVWRPLNSIAMAAQQGEKGGA